MLPSLPLERKDYKQEIENLHKYLKARLPTNVIMPLGNKNPLFRHANGQWGWGCFEKQCKGTLVEPTAGVGILLRTLAVLDADSPET